MKKIKHLFLAAALGCAALVGQAQTAPAIQWQKSLGGGFHDYDVANAIQQTTDGGYIVAGSATSYDNGDVRGNHGGGDFWVVKLNSHGDTVWQKSLGGSNTDNATSIQQTSDGGYIVAGYSSSTDGDVTGNHGGTDYWVVKINSTGGLQWQKSLGASFDDVAYSVQQTADGGYIVAGYSTYSDGDVTGNHGSYDCWVVKLDGTGGIQWQKSFGGSNEDVAHSIHQTADGGYVVAAHTASSDGDLTGDHSSYDSWVLKLNSTGGIQWQKSLGGSNADVANAIQQTTDGGYIVAGYSSSTDGDVTGNHGANDYWVVKLDGTGGIQWQKSLGGSGNDFATSVQQTVDGGYIMAGYSSSTDGDVTGNHGANDYWVVKLDGAGGFKWQKSMGGTGSEIANAIQQTTDGGYIVAGRSQSNDGDVTGNHGGNDYWVVKLGLAGSTVTTPTITIATQAGGALCANTTEMFTATVGNAGTSPAYQWQKNGVNVGTNSKTYTIAKLNAGDSVTCVLTVAGTAYKSNTLTASPMVKPAVSISSTATGGIACAGTAIIFTATATNGGTTPTYQWLKNGMAVGGSSTSYTDNSLATGDTIKVTLTSSAACPSPSATTTSKGLGFKVNPVISTNIYIVDTSLTQCAGDSRGFKAVALNGSQASYQWYKNNVKVGKNTTIYGDKKLNNNDSVWCVFTTKTVCATPNTAKSNVAVVRVNPLPTATISGTSCMGSTLTLNINSGIPVAQIAWHRNGMPVANYVHGGYNNFNGVTVATGQLSEPRGICTDNDGNLYIADAGNSRVQKWIPGSVQAITVAGGHGQGGADNQTDYPIGVFVDGDGSLYVADASNHRVQKWAIGASQGVTVAGGNGQGSAANQLNSPWGVYVAATGEIYVADAGNHRIQKWTPGDGFGVTVAGGHGMGTAAYQLDSPTSVIVDRDLIYIADAGNNRVQRWDRSTGSLDTTRGVTVAGENAYGLGNASYNAILNNPYGLCWSGDGIFVSDAYHQRIQEWQLKLETKEHLPVTEGITVAGTGIAGSAANQLNYPFGVCFVNKNTGHRGIYGDAPASIGSLFITDYANNRVQLYELTDSTNRAYAPDSAGTYKAVVTSLYGCTAATKDFVVKPTVALGATVTTNATSPICAGTKVAFTAAPVDASAKPHYQWYKNSVAVGKNSAVYTDATLKDLDGIWVMLTSKAACATPDTVVTEATVFNVNPLPAATTAITGPAKVTANDTGVVFSVNNTPGANYVWGVPSGCSIVAGNGTSSITVNWGTQGGKISAQTTNGCGLSKPVNKAVSVVATMGNKIGNNSSLVDKAEGATANAFLYPNPAASATKLRLSGFAGGVTVTVATMQGKVVWQQDRLTNGTYTLPLANLAQGMYLVSIKDKASIRTIRLVKVK